MLQSLQIINFRGFENHKIDFRSDTVVVGKNNAGKTTIVEALRYVSIVASRFRNSSYVSPPSGIGLYLRSRGIIPSLRNMEVNAKNMFHRYAEPPAIITATFSSKATIEVRLYGGDKFFAVISDNEGRPIRTQGAARNISKKEIPDVGILPQVAPLLREEPKLTGDYVKANVSSSTAYRHFRNQILLFPEELKKFKDLAESTWPGLRIGSVEIEEGLKAEPVVSLLVQDNDFVAEVGWMGHGLQMWLQTIWFLSRIEANSVVVLDEPDVYLHPDLQRQLIRIVQGRFLQTIVATHSVEIMSEIEPDTLLIIDRRHQTSRYADGQPDVQRLVENLGGVHNIQLARLWSASKCLLVEGEDLKFLQRFHQRLFNTSRDSLATLPNFSLGGWGGWSYAIGTSMTVRNTVDEKVITYCLLDSDYHTPDEVANRTKEAKAKGVELHIWSRKEIENYLLIPDAIQRVISKRLDPDMVPPTIEQVIAQIDVIAEELQSQVFDAFSHSFHLCDKAGGVTNANKRTRTFLDEVWKTFDGRISRIPGKETISRLSKWSKRIFNVSFSVSNILDEIRVEEISDEIYKVLNAVEKGQPFEMWPAD